MPEQQDSILMFPENYRYDNEHIWFELIDINKLRCGVTVYFCEKTGAILSVDYLKNIVNMEIISGEAIINIESLKDSILIKSPLSGTIIEINQLCVETPEIINTDPHGEGWLFVITTDNLYEYEDMMYSDEYAYLVIKESGD